MVEFSRREVIKGSFFGWLRGSASEADAPNKPSLPADELADITRQRLADVRVAYVQALKALAAYHEQANCRMNTWRFQYYHPENSDAYNDQPIYSSGLDGKSTALLKQSTALNTAVTSYNRLKEHFVTPLQWEQVIGTFEFQTAQLVDFVASSALTLKQRENLREALAEIVSNNPPYTTVWDKDGPLDKVIERHYSTTAELETMLETLCTKLGSDHPIRNYDGLQQLKTLAGRPFDSHLLQHETCVPAADHARNLANAELSDKLARANIQFRDRARHVAGRLGTTAITESEMQDAVREATLAMMKANGIECFDTVPISLEQIQKLTAAFEGQGAAALSTALVKVINDRQSLTYDHVMAALDSRAAAAGTSATAAALPSTDELRMSIESAVQDAFRIASQALAVTNVLETAAGAITDNALQSASPATSAVGATATPLLEHQPATVPITGSFTDQVAQQRQQVETIPTRPFTK